MILESCSLTPEPTRLGVLLAPVQVARPKSPDAVRAVWIMGRLVVSAEECPPEEQAAWLASVFVASVTEDDQLANVARVVPSTSPDAAPFVMVAGPDGAAWTTVPFLLDLALGIDRPLFDDGMYLTVSARHHRAAIQRVGRASAPVSDESSTLFGEGFAPKTPTDHVPLAYAAARSGDPSRAVHHFQAALRADVVRSDLAAAHFFNAACAASLAAGTTSGAPRDDFAALGLEWIAEDVKRRRARARAIEHALERPVRAAQREALEADRAAIEEQIEQARSGDVDLSTLRSYPAFPEVIAEREGP